MNRALFLLKFDKDFFSGLAPMIFFSLIGHVIFISLAISLPTFLPRGGHTDDLAFRVSLTSFPVPQTAGSGSKASIQAQKLDTLPSPPPAPKKKETVKINVQKTKPAEQKQQQPEVVEKTGNMPGSDESKEPDASTAGIGGSGISGSISGDASGISFAAGSDFEFAWYRATVMSKLKENWIRPVIQFLNDQKLTCTVSFSILKNGAVSDISVDASSGYPALDRSAVRSVRDSSPLPPLPYQFDEPYLKAQFMFELNPD